MDPRYLELAKQLTQYSTSLKKGEKVLLDLVDTPEEMGLALIRAVRESKAEPFLRLGQAFVGGDEGHGCLHCGSGLSQH